MNKMLQVKDITYDLKKANILCQPKFNKIRRLLGIIEHISGIHYPTI